MNRKRLYYGWPLVGVGFLIYGLGIAPAYYSWGFFAPELVRDLGLTREQVGSMFGAFTLTFIQAASTSRKPRSFQTNGRLR